VVTGPDSPDGDGAVAAKLPGPELPAADCSDADVLVWPPAELDGPVPGVLEPGAWALTLLDGGPDALAGRALDAAGIESTVLPTASLVPLVGEVTWISAYTTTTEATSATPSSSAIHRAPVRFALTTE
jgi:hypothetical protein